MKDMDKYKKILDESFGNRKIVSYQELLDSVTEQYDTNEVREKLGYLIYKMTHKNLIHSTGKGLYKVGPARIFTPNIQSMDIELEEKIKMEFPYIEHCVWNLSDLNNFSQHLINFNVTVLEVDRDAVNSVYLYLRESRKDVYLVKDVKDDLMRASDGILVRNLTTEAPLMESDICTTTLEKLLVDIFSDKEFNSFKGELKYIFDNAFAQYTINLSTLLRYSGRKKKRDRLSEFLKTIVPQEFINYI